MTDLSPAAQAVLDALCMDELNGPQQLMARAHAAAALHAAADRAGQVPAYPEATEWDIGFVDGVRTVYRDLLAIAAELAN